MRREEVIELDETGNTTIGIDFLEDNKVSCILTEFDKGVDIGNAVYNSLYKNIDIKYKNRLTMIFVESATCDCLIKKLNIIRDYLRIKESGVNMPTNHDFIYKFIEDNKI